jgi:hypothetical protein
MPKNQIQDRCYICKKDLSHRVNDAGGSRRISYPSSNLIFIYGLVDFQSYVICSRKTK